ncbi:DUF4225 domain-containing protein [Pseudomonas vranovensis]|uniref:DUF4225 domain-containing protein n=1 Tax=Pseudomonas vranovensis TaxID=321661 RepID=A0A423DJJ0_9PSED|nr:DUF4225 domain-containing protein [Pseudomonas vranovensis]ROL71713.1 hypothetical protein BHU25_15450 [Pseudomonas vranovensis]
MERMKKKPELRSHDLWEVSSAAARLTSYACSISARHLQDDGVRMQFNRELAYYAKRVVDDVEQRRLSPEEGLREIQEEQRSLLKQSQEIFFKGFGVAVGTAQVVAGGGICYASVGSLCVFFGVPLMAHGTNNIYENGRNLVTRSNDTEGPVRKGYQSLAKTAGFQNREGNIAYNSIDLGLSAYGFGRHVLKKDSWRLFRYLKSDFERGYKNMGAGTLGSEVIADILTGMQIHDEIKK